MTASSNTRASVRAILTGGPEPGAAIASTARSSPRSRLYETAQKAGGAEVGPGAKVMAGLVPERRKDGSESWYLNYQNADGREVLSVVIDARTGAVKNVFHTGK